MVAHSPKTQKIFFIDPKNQKSQTTTKIINDET